MVGGTAAVCCSSGMVDMVAVQVEVAELALVVELGYMAWERWAGWAVGQAELVAAAEGELSA